MSLTLDGARVLVYDIEVFPNFFLAQFWDLGKKWWSFREDDIEDLVEFITDKDLILGGFNNFGYDDTIMKWLAANPHATPRDIFKLSMAIIKEGRNNKSLFKIQYGATPWRHSLDVFQFFNKRGSLKEWECKEQLPRVVESPCDFEKDLPANKIPEIIDYCKNDVSATGHLLKKNWHLVQIRADIKDIYDLTDRVFVVGEAGIAQQVFMSLHESRTGDWITKTREGAAHSSDNKARQWAMNEIVSPRVKFATKAYKTFLAELLSTKICGDERGVRWNLDDRYKKQLVLGSRKYKLGVGGLHTVDGPGIYAADKETAIVDLDVESYYPSIIIEEGLYPTQLGEDFVDDMRKLRDERLAAKHGQADAKKKGDKKAEAEHKKVNAALKIVINSTFGKLNDAYSPLRSIPSALRVTINGQLMLLMLIERLEMSGAEILSANTDGVTIRWNRKELERLLPSIMTLWEGQTKHKLERADFKRYCRRDVNAYLVLKENGDIKRKGAFTPYPDTGKWDGIAVKQAAEAYLLHGIDPKKTIATAKPLDFLYYQRVKNGGSIYHGEELVGKIARWYVAKNGETIKRENPDKSRDKIPNGENAQLAMDVRDWVDLGAPSDLDREHYVRASWKLINSTKEKSSGKDASDLDDADEEDQ
jgi:hypothetical protein